MKLSSRLKELRKEFNITQMELGKAIHMKHSTLSDYERRNDVDPSISSLKKIAEYFEVSIDYLVGDTNTRQDLSFEQLKNIYIRLNEQSKLKVIEFAKFLKEGEKK